MTNKKPKTGRTRRNKSKSKTDIGEVIESNPAPTPKPKTKQKKKLNTDKTNNLDQQKLTFEQIHRLQQTVLDFIKGDELCQEIFGLSNMERKEIHHFARQQGVKTRSRNDAGDRVLTLSRSNTYRLNACLDNVRLSVTLQFRRVLHKALNELGRRRTVPMQSQRRNESLVQTGGLLGIPRVPALSRCTNATLTAERKDLPIYTKRNRIFQLLEMSQVLIINGATGSGKSTQLPQYLLEDAAAMNKPVRIVVSQPRRIAAISVSGRIAEERGESLGDTVGYIIRMESKYSNNTVLSLTTSGCLLRTLAMNGSEFFENTTHLVIDEVHDRDLDTDFLLLAIKLELERNKSLKVILMSATMDLLALSKYFDDAPVLNVEGRSFNVRVYSLEDILHITGYLTPQMSSLLGNHKNLEGEQLLRAYSLAHNINEMDIDNSLIVSLLQVLLLMGMKGAVIVYLPGYQDMTKLMDQLQTALPTDLIKVLLLHSQVDSQRQRDVFREYPNVQLKVVLSTNIGQTSITIPDLLYVIDTGRVKMKTYDPSTSASHLACTWISKADAQQRTGRAGRRKDGICYRLYSNAQFESFNCFTVPEILRHTLDEICLLAKIAAPNKPIEQFLAQALDRPQPAAIAQSCAMLKLLGVLRDEDESVTQLGHIIAQLPLDVQLAKCMIYGIYYQCVGSLSIITAYYSVRDPFVLPSDRSGRTEQRKSRDFFSIETSSDSIGVLQLYHAYMSADTRGSREMDRFCERNCLCRKSMDNFVSAVHTLRLTLTRLIKFVDMRMAYRYDNNLNMVRLALAAGLYPRIVYVDHPRHSRLVDESDPRVQLSRNSILPLCFAKRAKSNMSEWLVYVEKTRSAGLVSHIEHATLISTLMVALQCGKTVKLEQYVPELLFHEDETYNKVEQSILRLDSNLSIRLSTELGSNLIRLRSHIAREFDEMVASRTMVPSRCPSVDYVQRLLALDTDMSGLSATDIIFY
ncbi:PREDICTED: DExH-box ATP-dependent RNA helicase DExH2 [Drosophila arizonae]|uniref:DExH-box ATP-dependent RNA helicase DExH2 n=1 Tax=Drosophila arizonae TaxID=7263 RepID=A0ABM1PZA7_DROAR|nr:PREDICTED: DExH-box ATP-dependent RNA helicase DExH2 [Drosophila arizonae]